MSRAIAWPMLTVESGIDRYFKEIRRLPMLDPQEAYMLAKRWREDGDRDAAHQLITSHLRLVAKIARGYRGYGLPIADLISEGHIGLLQAVERLAAVPIFTSDHERRMYSWMADLIHHTA